MDVREKLVELFHQHNAKYVTFCDNCFKNDAEELNDKMLHLADYLISKGVTIPVRCGECKYWTREGNGYCDDGNECHNPYSKPITNASTAFTLMDFKSDGTAMAIGKVSEIPDTFEIGFDILVR